MKYFLIAFIISIASCATQEEKPKFDAKEQVKMDKRSKEEFCKDPKVEQFVKDVMCN